MSLVKSSPNEIRYDPNHALALIFRVLSKEYTTMPSKQNPRPPRLQYWENKTSSDGCEITFKGLILLSVFDLQTLLGLLAVAMQRPIVTSGTASSAMGRYLHNSLDKPAAEFEDDDPQQMLLDILDHMPTQSLSVSSVATCSTYELTKLVTGDDSAQSYKRVKESLFRLLHTTIVVKKADGSRYTANMVSSVYESKDKKTMSVAVNPVLTQSLRLDTGARYIRLYLDAFSTLSQVGKLLYTYLSARTWDAKPHEYTTETLLSLMYPALAGEPPVSRQAASKRTTALVDAMQSLNMLNGWKVAEKVSARGLQKWVVTRSKAS